jgi:multiple sugar transport system ATP-binding protein
LAEIAVRSVRKTFDRGRVTAVGGIDLTVADGELFVLLGPRGCGKTTLLRMIAGLEAADSGTIMIGGRDVTMLPPRKRDLAMVFRNYALFPHLTVGQNIAFGLRMKGGLASPVIEEKVREAADLLDLGDLLHRRPGQLPGGQRQRVAVARAIAVSPSVLLMDEPLSNLDAPLRLKFRSDLKRIVRELRATVIYVTHDQAEALSLADRMAIMRDGQVIQSGPPLEVYERPASTFVGGLLGSPPMNFLPVAIDAADSPGAGSLTPGSPDDGPRAMVGPDGDSFPVPEEMRGLSGRELLAGIRGENVEVTRGAGAPFSRLPGRVLVVEPLGAQTLVTVSVGASQVKVLTPPGFPAQPGGDVWLRPAPDKVRWYDPCTGAQVTPLAG